MVVWVPDGALADGITYSQGWYYCNPANEIKGPFTTEKDALLGLLAETEELLATEHAKKPFTTEEMHIAIQSIQALRSVATGGCCDQGCHCES